MELEQKSKTEIYRFEAKAQGAQSALQSPYTAHLTVEDGSFKTCDVSIKSPSTREHWAFYALVAAKINQICKQDVSMDEWQMQPIKAAEPLPSPAIEAKPETQEISGFEP